MSISSSALTRPSGGVADNKPGRRGTKTHLCDSSAELLMGTLYSGSVMAAALLVGAIVIGFAPLAAPRAPSAVKLLKLYLLRVSDDVRDFRSRGQKIF